MNELTILLIGCGKMGGSLLRGIVKSDNFDGTVDVIEPAVQDSLKEEFKKSKVNFYSDIKENKDTISYDLIIVATKPNICEEIFNGLNLKTEINGQNVETPHPRMNRRNFVIFPLYEPLANSEVEKVRTCL